VNASRVIGAGTTGGLLFLVAAVRLGAGDAELARLLILGTALGALVAIDIAEHRIPNRIVLPASVACAGLLAAGGAHPGGLVAGLAVVFLLLGLSVIWPASFGMGDVKLSLLLVVGLGGLASTALLLGLGLAALFGGLLVVRYGRSATSRLLPLAPFLGSGAAVVVLL
jgi:leader peptidase (prepilin peptidase) / N-methyltransferase